MTISYCSPWRASLTARAARGSRGAQRKKRFCNGPSRRAGRGHQQPKLSGFGAVLAPLFISNPNNRVPLRSPQPSGERAMTKLEQYQAKHAEVVKDQRKILEAAAAASELGELSAEQKTQYDALDEKRTKLAASIKREKELEAADLAAAPSASLVLD